MHKSIHLFQNKKILHIHNKLIDSGQPKLMTRNSFSKYYADELDYLNNAGQEFATAYPQIADALNIDINDYGDPHLKKLIQSFAFLTAKVKEKIDNQFEYIPSQLIQILHPSVSYDAPAATIMQFYSDNMLKLDNKTLSKGTKIKQNEFIFSLSNPLTLTSTQLLSASLEIGSTYNLQAHGLLKIQLSKITNSKLKFFINDSYENSFIIFRLLFEQKAKIYVLQNNQVKLVPVTINPYFESLDLNTDHTYEQMQEMHEFYHYYKSKLFFELDNLAIFQNNQETTLIITLAKIDNQNNLSINSNTFLLNCVTAINLFADSTNPITLTNRTLKYPLTSSRKTTNIHSVLEVEEYNIKGNIKYNHFLTQNTKQPCWIAQKETEKEITQKLDNWMMHIYQPNLSLEEEQTKTLLIKAYHYNLHTNHIRQNTQWNLEKAIAGLKCINITTCSKKHSGIPKDFYMKFLQILHTQYLSRAFYNNPLQLVQQLCIINSYLNYDHVGIDTYILDIKIQATAIYKKHNLMLLPVPCLIFNIIVINNPTALLFGHIIGRMFQKLKPIHTEIEYNVKVE